MLQTWLQSLFEQWFEPVTSRYNTEVWLALWEHSDNELLLETLNVLEGDKELIDNVQKYISVLENIF